MVVDEITLVGSRCGSFGPALQLLQNRLFDPLQLIDARYPLQDPLEAFQRAAQPGVLKVVISNLSSSSMSDVNLGNESLKKSGFPGIPAAGGRRRSIRRSGRAAG